MKNEKFIWLFILAFFFFFSKTVFAESSYVLPYPSGMPGSKFYQIRFILDEVKKYWSFGNFGQFEYNLNQSDKYLVEAKTLFEYRQYLLGYKALRKSDVLFLKVKPFLQKASYEKKDISNKKTILQKAASKHIEILEKINIETPDIFNWQPEKSLPTNLNLKMDIENSIKIRKNNL